MTMPFHVTCDECALTLHYAGGKFGLAVDLTPEIDGMSGIMGDAATRLSAKGPMQEELLEALQAVVNDLTTYVMQQGCDGWQHDDGYSDPVGTASLLKANAAIRKAKGETS